MSEPFLKVTSDFTAEFNETIKRFKRDAVLVGIPEEETGRKEGEINNATILAINEFGSEDAGIPARHPMSTGITLAQDAIAEELKKGAQAALTKGFSALDTYYKRAGFIASSSVKKVINDQTDFVPLSESTLAARRSKGFKGTKALIVTAQTRNAITFVIKGGS